jgi:SAM-dependent methyltransferase
VINRGDGVIGRAFLKDADMTDVSGKGMNLWGKCLMAHYKGDKTPIKIHRDDGRCDDDLTWYYFLDYDEWPEHEKEILKYVQGKVLDVGCGAGRHSLWLQQQGHEVVAIDVSPLIVEVARLRGVKDCRVMSVLEMPFEDNSFDTILFMGNNLGVAGNPDGTLKLFITLSQIARKGGRIIGTTYDPADTDDPSHLKYHELNRKRGRAIGQVTRARTSAQSLHPKEPHPHP